MERAAETGKEREMELERDASEGIDTQEYRGYGAEKMRETK